MSHDFGPLWWVAPLLVAGASAGLLMAYPRWQMRRHRRDHAAYQVGALPVDGHLSEDETDQALGIEAHLELDPPPHWSRLAARMETRSHDADRRRP